MYYPSKTQFKELAQKYNLIPIYREIIADVDTPVSAFLKLGESDYAFLLESVEGGERWARYSFIGNSPYLIIVGDKGKVRVEGSENRELEKVADPLEVIKGIISRYHPVTLPDFPPFHGGAVGYLGYDMVRYFEDIPRRSQDDLVLPDMVFMLTDTILIFDHLEHKIKVVVNAHIQGDAGKVYDQAIAKAESLVEKLQRPLLPNSICEFIPGVPLKIASNFSQNNFLDAVKKAKEYICAGDVIQVVISQRFGVDINISPFNIYRALRTINPSPYMYYLKLKELELIGSSPEPLVKVQGKEVITRPIAGTRPRGRDDDEDRELEKELLGDIKERAEHIMLVDLGRNDLGRICTAGSVKVDDLMAIERYSHVMHIVSNVVGRLNEGKDAFDVLRAAFPAGTVSGAPKIRAMEIIDELEPTIRGPYAGAVGYFSYSGNLDTCITIRTIVVSGNKAYVQAGAGIVYDSVPEKEFQETVNKARALLTAIEMVQPTG